MIIDCTEIFIERDTNYLVAEYHAEAVLPAFTIGNSLLSAKEVLESRELARVHIHVE